MNALQYIEIAKTEEIASEYKTKGYQVFVSPFDREPKYDLVAMKNGRKVAIEVIARSKLSQESKRIRKLRQKARQEGFDRFRLAVVSPPREIPVKVEGLLQKVFGYLAANLPDELAQLSSHVRVKSLTQVDVDEICITVGGIRVAGNGVVIVELEDDDEIEDGFDGDIEDFPLNFDVELDHTLKIKAVHEIVADTSSFYQY
jgi:predicted DNA-binding antitoxin AbrB/MazE fold protein